MQLGQIGINDTVEAKGLVEGKVITGEPVKIEQKMTKEPLRNVSVQHPIYQKEDLKEKTLTQKLEEQLAQAQLFYIIRWRFMRRQHLEKIMQKCRKMDFHLWIWRRIPL